LLHRYPVISVALPMSSANVEIPKAKTLANNQAIFLIVPPQWEVHPAQV
jgi:hypothetical protein